LSHIKLWEYIMNNKMGWTLILEDDAHFHPQFKDLLPKYWKDVPKDAKIVFLGYCGDLEKKNQKIMREPVMCMHGYMISWEGAKILIDNLLPMKDPVDIEIMNYFRKNNSNGCYVFNGDIFIDGIRPNDYKERNGNKCMFNGIIYQNQEDQGSTIHQIDTFYEYR